MADLARSFSARARAASGSHARLALAVERDQRLTAVVATAIGGHEAHRAVCRHPAEVNAERADQGVAHLASAGKTARSAAAQPDLRHPARLEDEMRVGRGDAVDLAVPGAGRVADVLQRGNRQVAVGSLCLIEDGEQSVRVVIVGREDALEWAQVDGQPRVERLVCHRPARAPQGRFLASLGVLLGRSPVDVHPVLGVDPAHVDDLDRAGHGALEAGLALEVAGRVVEQHQAAAMVR